MFWCCTTIPLVTTASWQQQKWYKSILKTTPMIFTNQEQLYQWELLLNPIQRHNLEEFYLRVDGGKHLFFNSSKKYTHSQLFTMICPFKTSSMSLNLLSNFNKSTWRLSSWTFWIHNFNSMLGVLIQKICYSLYGAKPQFVWLWNFQPMVTFEGALLKQFLSHKIH